jgi:hypothetical protein
LSLFSASLGAACVAEDGGPTSRVDLVDHSAWQLVEDGFDPWSTEDESALPCDPEGFGEEPPLFEVQTGLCDFATFQQPSLGGVRAGDLIQVIAWHLPLRLALTDGGPAPEPAEGHLVVRLGDQTLLEYRTEIPAAESAMSELLEANADVAPGAPVWLHVHNHGDNAWRLLEVSTGPADVFGGATS